MSVIPQTSRAYGGGGGGGVRPPGPPTRALPWTRWGP
jgi:hypothetical protein